MDWDNYATVFTLENEKSKGWGRKEEKEMNIMFDSSSNAFLKGKPVITKIINTKNSTKMYITGHKCI